MNLKYCLTGMLLFSLKVWSQEIKPLSVGDNVPAININTIFNYPAFKSNISAFTNKLVILDFMASNCASCVKVLPRFDSIQKVYGKKLQIFLVTYEKKEKVRSFLQRHPDLKLPVIGEDTILTKYFPHTFISHEVWLLDGVVKAITYPEYVTKENIATVVAKLKIDWPVKKDMPDFDYSKTLLRTNENETGENNPSFYSLFNRYMPNVSSRFIKVIDTVLCSRRVTAFNFSAIDLYLRAYGISRMPMNKVSLEVKDSSRFFFDKNKMFREAWKQKNVYCYESACSLSIPEKSMLEKMRSDLDLFLNIKGRMEKRKTSCLIIKRPGDVLPINSPAQNASSKPVSLKTLVNVLNETYPKPLLDESLYTEKVFIDNFSDLLILREELKKYGLVITTEDREIEMLVLSDKPNQSFNH